MTPEIRTERLVLRVVVEGDAEDVFAYVRNPNVLRYTTGRTPGEFAETEAFVRSKVRQSEREFTWAVRLKGEGRVIGMLEFGLRDQSTGTVDYALAEEYWNRGLATEGVRAVLSWAFAAHPALQRVQSAAMTANPASTRVQEKCGMRCVQVVQEKWEKFERPVELAVCEILRGGWEASREAVEPVKPPLPGVL